MRHYILLTVPEQDCPHSTLGVGSVPRVASLGLAPGAVPTQPVLGLVRAPETLPITLRKGL